MTAVAASGDVANALAYVRAVRERTDGARYAEFLDAMQAFKRGTITPGIVVRRVRACLKGHDDLLDGFRAFLPEGYATTRDVPSRARGTKAGGSGRGRPRKVRPDDDADEREAPVNDTRLASGQDLLQRIRATYADEIEVYDAFLQTLIKFRNKQFSAEEVVQKCAVLFYDNPQLLEGEDGLATFVPKSCKPPRRSSWFEWRPSIHHRFGSESFRLFVRTLLMCEYRSRGNPPEPNMRRWRLMDDDSDESDSDDYSSSEESEDESSVSIKKECGTLRPEQIPEKYNGPRHERILSNFERLTLELKPKDEEYCWADTKAVRQARESKEEIDLRGKRGRGEERDFTHTPRESPSPPPSFRKRRASARITAKVNRGIVYNRYRSLTSPDGLGRGGRMRMTRSMGTVDNDLPAKKNVNLTISRDESKMSPLCAERVGLHSLPANVIELIILKYATQEGDAELNQIREFLVKSLTKSRLSR